MNCKVCENTSTKNTTVSFFRFPKENIRCQDWADRCDLTKSLDKYGSLKFYKSFRICSEHFDPKDIIFDGRKKRLLQSAVPQFFLKTNHNERENGVAREHERKLKLVHNYCRLCAEETENLTDIFGRQGKTLNLEGKLKYFPLVVNKCDILPVRVCHRCISKINKFCEFITSCRRAERKLKVMLNMSESEEKVITSNENLIKSLSQSSQPEPSNLILSSNEILESKVLGKCHLNVKEINSVKVGNVFDSKPQDTDTFLLVNQSASKETQMFSCDHDYSEIIVSETEPVENKAEIKIKNNNHHPEASETCNICFKKLTSSLHPHFGSESHGNFFQPVNSLVRSNENSSTNNEVTYFKCKICYKVFHQSAFLKEHYSIHQLENSQSFSNFRQFENVEMYDICLIDFSSAEQSTNYEHSLMIHTRKDDRFELSAIKAKPKKVFRIECQYCEKLFKNKKLCRTHENTHSVATPCLCKQCGKQFRSKPSLRQHKSVHSEERLFSCHECGMSFKRKDTLGNHLRIHTGERPFICKICGFAFKQRGDCLKHEKNHVKTNESEVKTTPPIEKNKK